MAPGTIVSTPAAASVALVISEAASASSGVDRGVEALLTLGTVAASWLFVHVLFGLHYAHRFYAPDKKGDRGGLRFPGETEPDYWDFTYFSVVLNMTFQTSDVAITSRTIRRLVLLHSVIAFFFNVIILAITVNVVAGLL